MRAYCTGENEDYMNSEKSSCQLSCCVLSVQCWCSRLYILYCISCCTV